MTKEQNWGMRFSQRKLMELLYRKNLTLAQLQKEAGISSATLTRAVKLNATVRPSTANKIAKVLGVDVLEIMQDVEPTEQGA